jgi:hypothetical protein
VEVSLAIKVSFNYNLNIDKSVENLCFFMYNIDIRDVEV